MSEGEIGWMVGLFEGEGYIMYRGVNQVVLGINMTDLDVLERFSELAECGTLKLLSKAGYNKSTKDCYSWTSYNKLDNMRLLLLMLSSFGKRRSDKALGALERLAKNKGGRNKYSRP